MANPIPTTIVKTVTPAAKTGVFVLWKYIKYTSMFLLFLALFLGSIIESVQTRSLEPMLYDLGGTLLLSTNELASTSQDIISTGNIYDFSNGVWHGIWNLLTLAAEFIAAAWIVYVWIKMFAWIVAQTPFSFPGNNFTNYSFGTLIYMVLQMLAITVLAAAFGKIGSITDAIGYMTVPWKALILFFKAIFVFFVPASEYIDKASGTKLNQSSLEALIQ